MQYALSIAQWYADIAQENMLLYKTKECCRFQSFGVQIMGNSDGLWQQVTVAQLRAQIDYLVVHVESSINE